MPLLCVAPGGIFTEVAIPLIIHWGLLYLRVQDAYAEVKQRKKRLQDLSGAEAQIIQLQAQLSRLERGREIQEVIRATVFARWLFAWTCRAVTCRWLTHCFAWACHAHPGHTASIA